MYLYTFQHFFPNPGCICHPLGLGHGDVLDELSEADGVDEGHGENDVPVQPVTEEQRDDVLLAVGHPQAVQLHPNPLGARGRHQVLHRYPLTFLAARTLMGRRRRSLSSNGIISLLK